MSNFEVDERASAWSTHEPSSAANSDELRVTHAALVWRVDMNAHVIRGSVTLHCTAQRAGVDRLRLDTKALTIERVRSESDGVELAFALGDAHIDFGAPLEITLSSPLAQIGDSLRVTIDYSTSPTASALQWLAKEQTADGIAPFLFSQCQAIHARSMIPLQDAPGVKFTYEASVTVPAPLVVLMSATRLGEPDTNGTGADATLTYHFEQKQPLSSYLVAIAVGALESRDIGPRSKVWSEASMVDAGAFEFAETEQFIQAGEKLLGPYVWGHYDILLMPPSFPYGGMENPTMTYVTPTLIAGDRSLANVVAHEIAHSWTGNLATNLSWQHFWLNEGFTRFVERWIIGHVYGAARRDFSVVLGRRALRAAIEQFGAAHEFTKLIPNLDGKDPDDAFSQVPYEKGFALLDYLASLVGREPFDGMLRAYIERFAGKTLTSEDFRLFFLEHFAERRDELERQIDWKAWLHAPGPPPVLVELDTSLTSSAQAVAQQWLAHNSAPESNAAPDAAATGDWFAGQFMVLLDELSDAKSQLSERTLSAMDQTYRFSESKNTEIVSRWLWLALDSNFTPVYDAAAKFAARYGRMKFCRPTYRALANASEAGKRLAVQTFVENRQKYHPIAQKMIARDLEMN